jgi:nucleoid-associated protein YgaU
MANQGEVAQALQGAGVSVSGLDVKTVGGMTAVYGSVDTDADKTKAESAIEEKLGKISNHIEVRGAKAGAGRTYTVKAGDSLSKIAKDVYDDASQWKKIYQANTATIKDPDKIQPGWTLTIPA